MTCAGCARSAYTIANGISGISEVQVRYASGAFKATIDHAAFDLNSLKEKLAKAGYGLTTEYRTPQERIVSQHAALIRKRNELILATTLALPLLVIGMMHLAASWVFGVQFFVALALSAYFGRHIHKKAFQLALKLATNMDTLVSLGSLVAFTFSIVGWINHQHQQIYFESAGLIIYFILIGKYLEDRGKASNSKALAELIALQPQQALRVEDGKEERVPVEVLELDVEGRKLSLGHKQTTENPWDKYSEEFAEGTIHKATIADVVDKGATINFNEDIVGFVPQRHMEKEDGKKLVKGEEAEFKIIEFNKDFKRTYSRFASFYWKSMSKS